MISAAKERIYLSISPKKENDSRHHLFNKILTTKNPSELISKQLGYLLRSVAFRPHLTSSLALSQATIVSVTANYMADRC